MPGFKDKLILRLPAVGLLVAMLLFWGWYDPYRPAAPPLLEGAELKDAMRIRGDVSEAGGVFRLHVPAGGKAADLRFGLEGAERYAFIRLSGSIRTEDVVPGKYSWTSARLVLIQRDSAGAWVPSGHNLLSKDGSVPWTAQTQEFELEPNTASVEVVLQQTGKSGTAEFRDIMAQPVQHRPSFSWFRILFAAGWVAMAVLYYRRCRLDHRKLRVLILLNAVAILYGTLMPGDWIADTADHLKEKVAQAVQKQGPDTGPEKAVPDKTAEETRRINRFNDVVGSAHQAGHFLLFASLCFLVYLSAFLEKKEPGYFFKVGADVLLFAAISESLQYLTIDRTPGIHDWLTDVYGLLAAMIVFFCISAMVHCFHRMVARGR